MVYAALLRGINVGGNNKIGMAQLKTVFEQAGMENVKTYINSGNIIFYNKSRSPDKLAEMLEAAIEKEFGFKVRVLLRDINNIKAVIGALPGSWKNDAAMKCDVLFLWKEFDRPGVLNQLIIKPGIDEVKYVPGAILWRVDRKSITRSGMMKIVGTKAYKQMTVRNCNTARKLLELMDSIATINP